MRDKEKLEKEYIDTCKQFNDKYVQDLVEIRTKISAGSKKLLKSEAYKAKENTGEYIISLCSEVDALVATIAKLRFRDDLYKHHTELIELLNHVVKFSEVSNLLFKEIAAESVRKAVSSVK